MRKVTEPGTKDSKDTFVSRVSKGGLWALGMNSADVSFSVAKTVILARLLLPEHFGQVGIAQLVISVLTALSQTGFDEALIQKGTVTHYQNTAWTMQVLRGTILFMAIAGLSCMVGWAFGEPMAAPLLRVLGLVTLIEGFHSIGAVLLRRDLEFSKYVAYVAVMRITDFVVTVVFAIVLRNAWALVWGAFAGAVTGLVASFVLHPCRPRLEFDRVKVNHLFRFGRWVLASSGLFYLFTHVDDFLVARILGASNLGLYQMAYTISNLPATAITAAVSQVAFPTLSRLKERTEDFGTVFTQAMQMLTFVSVPLGGGIVVFASDVVALVLGENWIPMIPALQLLALWGTMRSYSKIAGTALYALGQPDLLTKLNLGKLALLLILVWPLTTHWGIRGTALAVVLSVAPIDPIAQYAVARSAGLRLWPLAKMVVLPMACTMAMIGIVMVCRAVLPMPTAWAGLVVQGVIAVSTYLILIRFSEKYFGYQVLKTIGDFVKNLEITLQVRV